MDLSEKVKNRIKANRIVGYMYFRDHSSSHPGKNSWDLCGHPVYYWKFKAALESKYLEKIILYTEVEEAWKLAREMSDKFIIVKRTLKQCQEPNWETVDDLKTPLSRLSMHSDGPDWRGGSDMIKRLLGFEPIIIQTMVCCPLETSQNLDKLVEKYFEDDVAEWVCLAYRVGPGYWTNNFNNPKYLFPVFNFFHTRRQDHPPLYRLSGSRIMTYQKFGRQRVAYVEIPAEEGIEIEDKRSLELARFYMEKRLKNENLHLD